jgi:hypothetical protein
MRGSKTAGLAAVATLAAAGCGGGESEPKPISGQPKRVVAVVERLDDAIRRHAWRTVCDLLTPAARGRAGGKDCARLLAESGAGVRRSRVRVLSVAVDGRRAAVKVSTRAQGQRRIDETIALVRSGRDWRIESLLG